ncbi:MAG: dienelactone hydrolase family protein [Actinomycetota bacterium]
MSDTDGPTGYLAPPDGRGRPGVLVLPSWWGVDDAVRDVCERLADEGFCALAPDLLGGVRPVDVAEAEAALAAASPDELAKTVMLSIDVLRGRVRRGDAPIGIVGFAMGASLGLWAATRRPAAVAAMVGYYGAQSLDFDDVEAEVLLHFAERDDLVGEDDRVTTEAFLRMGGVAVEVVQHAGTEHGFAERGRVGHDAEAADVAWASTVDLLRRRLVPETA